jgi:hypothetical protein
MAANHNKKLPEEMRNNAFPHCDKASWPKEKVWKQSISPRKVSCDNTLSLYFKNKTFQEALMVVAYFTVALPLIFISNHLHFPLKGMLKKNTFCLESL